MSHLPDLLCAELRRLLQDGEQFIINCPLMEWEHKPAPAKWSKKEILGHLIDSGINNLQRFTEIQFGARPFLIRQYDQEALVSVNGYQEADTGELLELWKAINLRLLRVIARQKRESLEFPVEFKNGDRSDLKFLMEDYIRHTRHHLNQIKQPRL